MCFTGTRARTFSDDRAYQRYAEEKSRIPKGLPAAEYDKRVKALMKKYKI